MSKTIENIEKKFDFPKCWNDNTRMHALFSPFRVKSINPENYDAKLSFWKDLIVKYCAFKGSSDFCLKELRRAFQRNNTMPYCLETVLEDMRNNKEIRLKDEYLNDPLNGWTTWTINSFVKKPFYWGVQKVLQTINTTDETETNYIILNLAKEQAENLNQILEIHEGEVLPFEELKSMKDINLNQDGLYISLTYLNCFKKVFLEYVIEDGVKKICLVKIPSKTAPAKPITETDRSMYTLGVTENNLVKELSVLEEEIKKNDILVRQYVRDGKKSMAKTCLRKKHLLQKNMDKRHSALENIQSMLARLQNTQTDEAVFDAYKIGSKTLKSIFDDANMNLENVEEVMDDIKEAYDIHDEVQQSIANLQVNTDHTEDAVLEEELMELLATPTPKKEKEEIKKPSVPVKTSTPTKEMKTSTAPSAQSKEIENTVIKELEKLDLVNDTLSDLNETKESNEAKEAVVD